MAIKLMIAAVVAILGSIVLGAGVLIFAKDNKSAAVAAVDAPHVKVDQYAPDANVDPMNPVAPDEADRRATLHGEIADTTKRSDNATKDKSGGAYVAAPVVERVGDLGDPNDALARKLYGDSLFSPEPTNGGFEIVKPEPKRESRPARVREEPPKPTPAKPKPAADPAADLLKRAGDLGKFRVVTDRKPPEPTIEIVQQQ